MQRSWRAGRGAGAAATPKRSRQADGMTDRSNDDIANALHGLAGGDHAETDAHAGSGAQHAAHEPGAAAGTPASTASPAPAQSAPSPSTPAPLRGTPSSGTARGSR